MDYPKPDSGKEQIFNATQPASNGEFFAIPNVQMTELTQPYNPGFEMINSPIDSLARLEDNIKNSATSTTTSTPNTVATTIGTTTATTTTAITTTATNDNGNTKVSNQDRVHEPDLGSSFDPPIGSVSDSKMSVPLMPDWDFNTWVTGAQIESAFPTEELIAFGAPFNHYAHAMYQNPLESLPMSNPSCQTLVTASSSDAEPCLLATPPKTSPAPTLPQDPLGRRGSNTSELANDFNTIRLQQPRSRSGLHGEVFCPPANPASGPIADQAPSATQPSGQSGVAEAMATTSLNRAASQLSPLPSVDLASRRKRPRPASLRPDTQRSQSCTEPMTMSPTRTKIPSMGVAPSASVRRIKSTGQNLNVMSGRIQKSSSGSLQMSPRNLRAFLNSSAASNVHIPKDDRADIPQAPTVDCAPLTPFSPENVEFQCPDFAGNAAPTWNHNGEQPVSTTIEAKPDISSPPATPFKGDAFPQMFGESQAHDQFHHGPPQSAPAYQTTFFQDSPPMAQPNFNQLCWQLPSSTMPNGTYFNVPSTLMSQTNPLGQYGLSNPYLQPMGPPQHYVVGPPPVAPLPPTLYGNATPPQKEMIINLEVGPKPQGAPQPRKKYEFNHTTPKDYRPSVYAS